MDKEKLAKMQAQAQRIGGKGTPRRKQIKKSAATVQGDDRKLQAGLKKLNVQPLGQVEEVNMFKEDGNVLHFEKPVVHSALSSNTTAIYGTGQTKDLTELVPGILNQLGPDSLAQLRKLAESYSNMTSRNAAANAAKERAGAGGEGEKDVDGDEEDIPDLVDNFEEAEEKKEGGEEAKVEGENKLDELN